MLKCSPCQKYGSLTGAPHNETWEGNQMYDLVFKNAKVLDGTGAPWFISDVAVKDGFIVRVGRVEGEAVKEIDAKGLYLSPGFIDAHSHSDQALVVNPTADSKVMQGVTLEVIGQCGSSAAPRAMGPGSADEGSFDEVESPCWTDMASYMKVLETNGVSLNVAALVGHGTIRRQVMGSDRRAPDSKELELMKKLVHQAMEQGAFGLSTGLIYVPGTYATTDEVVELAKVASRYGGVYFTHIRDEADRLIEALEEAICIGFEAEVPVQVSHFKAMGQRNWGKINDAIARIEKAREHGLDITADQYPYVASSTGLASSLPSWVWAGGRREALKRLKDPSERKKVLDAITGRENWANLVIASLSNEGDLGFIGQSVEQIGEILGVSPEEACLRLLERNDGIVQIVNFAMSEDDVKTVMSCPWVMAGSDSRALNVKTAKGQPHPRSYGTFARILGRYVREQKLLRLEEAVRKMTSLPAMRLGLQDRGILREGMRADLVLFDADRIIDKATFEQPHQYAEGVLWVLVNGVPVVQEGQHTGKRPGMVLRRR
ncbi:MAG TPA: D-aminoacylase [Firmicutes bacterium]|nr:D-aminoacylase [Candidatus Fermentithermobacillaceae bacterium]